MKFTKKIKCVVLGLALFTAGTLALFPEISIADGINVKILYDYSGSMYPGYPDHRRHEINARYFHQYPHFRQWLTGFVRTQARFNARRLSMSVFRSQSRGFREGDIKQVHAPVDIDQFDVNHAFSYQRPGGLDYTFLSESLDHFTSGNFEGLVWLISDNRVETGGGASTRDFFTALRDTDKYRSIHIYKLPFEDSSINRSADIAIYGILVSPSPLPASVSSWYDQRFAEFRSDFQGQQHLKLKDLSVEPIRIKIEPIEVDIASAKKKFTEGGIIKMLLSGTVKSNLTQHTITGGTLNISIGGDFIPDEAAVKKYKVKKIPGQHFRQIHLNIEKEIPPMGESQLPRFYLKSKKKVTLSISGLGNLIKAATSGVRVRYAGAGVVSSKQLDVALKQEGRNRITGIYSSTDIGPIFGSQSTIKQIAANPSRFDIAFTLKTGGIRGVILLLILLAALVPFAILAFVLNKKESYHIKKDGKEETAFLRRLGSYYINEEGTRIGVLTRGMGNIDSFTPNTDLASLTVSETGNPGEYNVTMTLQNQPRTFRLVISPDNTGREVQTKQAISAPDSQIGPPGRRGGSTPGAGPGTTPRRPGTRPSMRKPG